jgi:hypothetical protein
MSGFAADVGEVLEAGYGTATPAGDNALLDYARSEADGFGALATAVGGRVARDATLGLALADTGSATPFGNTAHLTKPVGDDAIPALVSALHGFFGGHAGGPYMVFSPWPIGDLSGHGFHPVGHPPLMLRAQSAAPLPPNPTLRVARVESDEALADFEQTIIEAYPVPELQPWQLGSFLRPAALATQWRFFVGYDGDRCVATAAAWLNEAVTLVELVSVRDECRGKGYGAAITAAATHAAPGNPAMLIASDLGRPIYDKLGYLPLLRYTLYVGMRASA